MALRRRGAQGHDLFPGFDDVHEIGVGSLAVVFRARELGTNRQVALKLLNVRDASHRAIESFERESIALGALSSHPNIVTLYRTFRTPDGRPVLVLELCSGAVADRLRDGAGLPLPDVLGIGIKIAGALETAHRGGILHRDVKPQNILVTEFGEPALADFGVAMLQSATQTTAGLFDFTTLHAAPELLEGRDTSAATDVYELASSLYQLVAGQSAFRAYDGESPASVILRILRDPVRPLSGANVPASLSDLLIRAMSKKKDERPPTAAEFAAELSAVEIQQGWNRTQFLIRDPGSLGTGLSPAISRLPAQLAPRPAAPEVVLAMAPTMTPTTGWIPPSGPPYQAAPTFQAAPPQVSGNDGWSAPTLTARHAAPEPPVHAEPTRHEPTRPEPTHHEPTHYEWTQHDRSRPEPPQRLERPPAAPRPQPTQPQMHWPPPPQPFRPEAQRPTQQPIREPSRPQLQQPPLRSGPTLPSSLPPADASELTVTADQPPTDVSPADLRPLDLPQPDGRPLATRSPDDRLPDDRLPDASLVADELARPGLAPLSGLTASGAYLLPDPASAPADDRGALGPAFEVERAPSTGDVPVWAVRSPGALTPSASLPQPTPQTTPQRTPQPTPQPVTQPTPPLGAPQFSSDLSLDPMSLREKATLRSGRSSITITGDGLRMRVWFRRFALAWPDVLGFEVQLDPADGATGHQADGGHIVALTTSGPVDLAATRRDRAELRYVYALLEAYRFRAQRIAAGYR